MNTDTYTLEHWLDYATKGLGRWARKRVATEIAGHYDEAYHRAVDRGLGADEAEALALESLGDADEACTRFKKTHLTLEEEHKLSKMLSRKTNTYRFGGAYLIAYGIGYGFLFGGLLGVVYAVLMSCFGIMSIAQSLWYPKGLVRRAWIFNDVVGMVSLVLLTIFFTLWSPISSSVIVPIVTAVVLWTLYSARQYRKVYRKLPKHLSNDDMELIGKCR